jgi:hypothetical protein
MPIFRVSIADCDCRLVHLIGNLYRHSAIETSAFGNLNRQSAI